MEPTRRPFKICNPQRNKRKGIVVGSLLELKERACLAFGFELASCRVFLENDGTEIEDDEYLNTLQDQTTLIITEGGGEWTAIDEGIEKSLKKHLKLQGPAWFHFRLASNVGGVSPPPAQDNVQEHSFSMECEPSLDEPSDFNQETSNPQSLTYKIVEKGTMRGKPKLIDSLGYGYNVKRPRIDGKEWQCTNRPKGKVRCPATVFQKGDNFKAGPRSHNHTVVPTLQRSSSTFSPSLESNESLEIHDDIDAPLPVSEFLLKQIKRNPLYFVSFSNDQLQSVVNCEVDYLARGLGMTQHEAGFYQETCQRELDKRTEMQRASDLLKLYDKGMQVQVVEPDVKKQKT